MKIKKKYLELNKKEDEAILKCLKAVDRYMGKNFKYMLGASIGTYLAFHGLRGIVIHEEEEEEKESKYRIPEYEVI